MKNNLFLFLLLSFSAQITAQPDVNSLWKTVRNLKEPDTVRLQAFQRICAQGYLYTKPDTAAILADEMYRMARKLHQPKYQAYALNVLGASSSLRGDLKQAIGFFTRSLKIMEKLHDLKGICSGLNNIGVVYDEEEDFPKAKEYYTKALNAALKLKKPGAIALSYGNLGNVYRSLGDFSKSIDYHQKAIRIYRDLGDTYNLGTELHSLGTTYFDMNDLENVESFNLQSLPHYEESGNYHGLPEVYNILGKIAYRRGDQKKAIAYNLKALDLAKETELAAMEREANFALYESYQKTGRFKDALAAYKKYIVMRDSIRNKENQQEVMRQELSYNFEKQQAVSRKEHEKELAVADERSSRQKISLFAVIGGLLLVTGFTALVLNRLQITRRQKVEIEQQKELVEEKQKEILDSIAYAKRLQEAILPPRQEIEAMLPESFIYYQPKDIVAGDFYWMEKTGNTLLVAVADCTGHGVPGAMVSVVCSTALNRAVLEFGLTDPGEILDQVRNLVLETFAKNDKEVKDGMDISLLTINQKNGEIKWAGANNPLWYISKGELQSVTADKQPIGSSPHARPFTTHHIQLEKGDAVYLFTDGYADQFGGDKGKKFKYQPLKDLLLSCSYLSMAVQKKTLEQTFTDWKSSFEQVDDVCIMGIKIS